MVSSSDMFDQSERIDDLLDEMGPTDFVAAIQSMCMANADHHEKYGNEEWAKRWEKAAKVLSVAYDDMPKFSTRYFAIISTLIGEQIGVCTNEGLADVRKENPNPVFCEITKEEYDEYRRD